uniref:Uncharacterized protein n=1 Tax=Melopsittacus undulatus TaxID=13146 RepID=A0A8C6JFA0_MELUD
HIQVCGLTSEVLFPTVGAEEEQRFVGLVEENYKHFTSLPSSCIAVNIYVKVFTNSPFLLCMDLARAQEELIDPNYLWIGPDGRRLEGQLHVNLLEPGKLMLLGFKESMSGAYTCALSHQVLETTTQKEREVSETYRFMVCTGPLWSGGFVKCMVMARDRIEEFFQKQTGVLRHEFQTVPTIHYVENSFSVTPIDSCRPGFGKNNAKHRGCAGCCVVCEPGTYSPDNRVTCQVCLHPRVRMYGARLTAVEHSFYDVLFGCSCQFWNPAFLYEQLQNFIHPPLSAVGKDHLNGRSDAGTEVFMHGTGIQWEQKGRLSCGCWCKEPFLGVTPATLQLCAAVCSVKELETTWADSYSGILCHDATQQNLDE